ncbi:Peritrophin-1 like protein [Argiope bruennichi]|uniref:Peritrophin-1 like protein n=1 Tax=Argiope bruennichi TaxID=94029 RepID=A0A8T0EUW6_ARGBR|nr:Peritrophin-1 like protein [Argiope bruennichi]
MNSRYLFLIFLIPLIEIARSENEVENEEDSGTGQRELRAWPWDNKRKFICPSLFGTFADIFDCSAFYICVGGVANRKKCNRRMQFDKYRKVCLPFIIAVCDKGDDDGTTARPTTKNDGGDTTKDTFTCPSILGNFAHPDDCSKYYSCTFYIPTLKTCSDGELFDTDKKQCKKAKDVNCGSRKKPDGNDGTTALPTTKNDIEVTTKDKFTCPSILGTFQHPDDCSKYYTCTVFIPSLKTCPDGELFDGVKKQCKPAKDVHCGTRQRPSEATTEAITTTPISTETPTPTEPETATPTEPETTPTEPETTTPTPTEPETTTPTEPETTTPTPTEPETTTPTEPETTTPTPTEPETTTTTTTEEPTTTKRPKVTAPDTDCDEDDVDCIIDDLGENT